MLIPKKIEKMLAKREKLAIELMTIERELDDWLEKKGADLNDPDLTEGVITSCLIYAEPWVAKQIVESYIENKL